MSDRASSVETTLVGFSDDELKNEIKRRNEQKLGEHWFRDKLEAKYFCPTCGEPEGWHTLTCWSDVVD